MKKTFVLCMIAILLFGCASCAGNNPSAPPASSGSSGHVVVFSLFNDNNPWPIALTKDLQKACDARGVELTVMNAKGSAEQQYNDILSLDSGTVNMLLLSSVDKEIGADCLSVCKEKNIPVILAARNADGLIGQDYISLIACDYELVGYSQGMSLIRLFGNEKCNIVELAGDPGSSNTASIASGFRRALESYSNKNYKIITTKNHNFSTREALDSMESVIQSETNFQAVFCHSDADALGAIQALKSAGLTPGCDPKKGDIIITSNCGFEDAIKAVAIGELYNTIDLNARIGDLIITTVEKYWNGEFITPRIQVTYREITKDNVSEWIGKGY